MTASKETPGKTPRLGIGWPVSILVLTGLAVNLAGFWGIATARRGALEEAERLFRLQSSARARALESHAARTRADLAFLLSSPAFRRLEPELASSDPRVARWRRLAVEGALLLFLRDHAEMRSLVVTSSADHPLVAAGRRGGVPVLWTPSSAPAERSSNSQTIESRIRASFDLGVPARPGGPHPRLDVALDPGALLSRDRNADDAYSTCVLGDGNGTMLAADGAGAAALDTRTGPSGRKDRDDRWVSGETIASAEGWSAPPPWQLTCSRPRQVSLGSLEPIAARYRMLVFLNLVVMALVFLLGSFALQQFRGRQTLEARAREEARVRELERQLFHAERLSTAGRLAAGMAHEINNPLEGISNYLRLAQEDLERGDSLSARRRLTGVEEGVERAAGIVRRVLAHADPGSPGDEILDLNTLVRQAAAFVQCRNEFARIEFRFALDPALTVEGSQVMLGQVFLNLILNACEAQPHGGEVLIRTERKGSRALVGIWDRGPGILLADQGRIFEPFFSTKSSTGLGLSICYSIVQQHGGELGVEPRPGGGSIFIVRLPALARMAEAGGRTVEPGRRGHAR